ncbi:MAG: 4-alpha-glucanotransferase [Planctomycetes bacterium HGW-Planctomycetes-1]|nr:MAG: 4-alpha-glucanotransferase [Planctomycetes bacterium HGW-Planctomycetes-1]
MNKRGSGILLHITSLPSPFGIGDLGPWAYRFADFLSQTNQSYWQILPLNPTDLACGNSPYSSISAFAGNTLLISPELLVEQGLLSPDDVAHKPSFTAERTDYASVIPYKGRLFNRAFEHFKHHGDEKKACEEFCAQNREWLEDVALFTVIKNHHQGRVWQEWEAGFRDRDRESIETINIDFQEAIEREKFLQYLFFKQLHSLKNYCNNKGIKLIGDIPIYVSYDSADVWTHTDLFKLDKNKRPLSIAGVPPDYFSATGQLWGNPVYRWDVLQKTGYRWWIQRLAHNLSLFDVVRIDHFRGFVAFWEVPATETTALNGRWEEAPAVDFFATVKEAFPAVPIIAEDLGLITDDVKEIINRLGFPGMRVLLFAFGEDLPAHPYLPHNYVPNCIAYTGTHDNNTVKGWFENEAAPQDKARLCCYVGKNVTSTKVHEELIRLAMMSVADTVIIPLQDVLGLGQEAQMNRPAIALGNWQWRFLPEQLTTVHTEWLKKLTCTYGRAQESHQDDR